MVYVPTGSGEGVLHELDAVQWGSLKHCYGYGDWRSHGINAYTKEKLVCVMPGPRRTLEALARGEDIDDDSSADAIEGLHSTIMHQGSFYEVTAHFVPFAAAIAAGPRHPSRPRLLQWLLLVFAQATYDVDAPYARDVHAALRASERLLSRATEAGDHADAFRWLASALEAPPTPALSDEADRVASQVTV